ncbi:hypothetical protein V6N11_060428 [Hibiscus sabdariffa]|uniref:RING-type domain-containing protein n=1 Tax=Hibiscus sabdariffa TaxID=183260 RepID=A0ABR2QQB2_9ROSI
MFSRLDSVPITHPAQIHRFQDKWTRFIPPMALWICVSVLLRCGTFGDRLIVLGPSTCRLMKATSVFAERVEVRDESGKGALVYEFLDKPELSKEVNWSSSSFFVVELYGQKGYSLWLNKGSKISVRWATQTSRLDKTEAIMIKGGMESMMPIIPFPFDGLFLNEAEIGKEAEFTIDEDDKYYVGMINSNPIRTLQQLIMLISTDALFIIVMLLVLKALGACNCEETEVSTMFGPETVPILSEKPAGLTYGTATEEGNNDETGSSNGSSEDLYDAKLCVVCYDEQHNCFFVPCGHYAICYECAKRIVEEDNKMCPICRRVIYRVRRLFSP